MERLTNQEKLRILEIATSLNSTNYEALYKRMVQLITEKEKEED